MGFGGTILCFDANQNGIITQSYKTQDKECYDIDVCGSNSSLFVTVGLAGIIHVYDTRQTHFDVFNREKPIKLPDFKMKHDVPLLRSSWCPNNSNFIAAIPLEDARIFVYDIRYARWPVLSVGAQVNPAVSALCILIM